LSPFSQEFEIRPLILILTAVYLPRLAIQGQKRVRTDPARTLCPGANQFWCNLCFSLSSTDLWRRGLGRGSSLSMGGSWGGGTSWEPLSLSLSPLARGEGIQFDTFLPKLCQKLICAPFARSTQIRA
jgi:hypothetical protein